jgi:hypothetical protein
MPAEVEMEYRVGNLIILTFPVMWDGFVVGAELFTIIAKRTSYSRKVFSVFASDYTAKNYFLKKI